MTSSKPNTNGPLARSKRAIYGIPSAKNNTPDTYRNLAPISESVLFEVTIDFNPDIRLFMNSSLPS
jgi:hypothetical protein